MTGPTHRQYAISWGFIAAIIIYELGLSQINYYLALVIILMTAKQGAKFPDVDHNWQNVSEKTVPNWIVNKLIHLTGGKHRSWQTHSIDILLIISILAYAVPKMLFSKGILSNINLEVVHIIMIGFLSGWWSHMFADMLNSVGVRLFCWGKIKVKFVPKQLFGMRFNTGNEWEAFCYKSTKIINLGLGFISVMYPIIRNIDIQSIVLYLQNLI